MYLLDLHPRSFIPGFLSQLTSQLYIGRSRGKIHTMENLVDDEQERKSPQHMTNNKRKEEEHIGMRITIWIRVKRL
jgi:hypothetical protein